MGKLTLPEELSSEASDIFLLILTQIRAIDVIVKVGECFLMLDLLVDPQLNFRDKALLTLLTMYPSDCLCVSLHGIAL
jgi:hypothetical protein